MMFDYDLVFADEESHVFLNTHIEVEDTKYYWRKKKEHLCSFENLEVCYLNFGIVPHNMMLSNTTEIGSYKTKFTEAEAKELLGDDFEMFERVDIE